MLSVKYMSLNNTQHLYDMLEGRTAGKYVVKCGFSMSLLSVFSCPVIRCNTAINKRDDLKKVNLYVSSPLPEALLSPPCVNNPITEMRACVSVRGARAGLSETFISNVFQSINSNEAENNTWHSRSSFELNR